MLLNHEMLKLFIPMLVWYQLVDEARLDNLGLSELLLTKDGVTNEVTSQIGIKLRCEMIGLVN